MRSSNGKRTLSILLLAGLLPWVSVMAAWAAPVPQPADPLLDEARLGALLWERNPEIRRAAQAQGFALTEVERAGTLDNPEADLGIASLPLVGTLAKNPEDPDEEAPWNRASNFTVSLTQPLDLWRRDLRVSHAEIGVALARQETRALFQERTADLLGVVARLGAERRRVALLESQLASLDELRRLSAVGVRETFVPALELEKLNVEAGRLRSQRDQAMVSLEEARSDWTLLTRTEAPELDARRAADVLAHLARLPEAWPDERALLAAAAPQRQLRLRRDQAQTELAIAERRGLPDVALRFGYTYDTLAGNVLHSVQSGLTLGLPVWNAGQLDRRDAQLQLRTLEESAGATLEQDLARGRALRSRARELDGILARLQSTHLSAARATLARVEEAAKKRLLPLSDTIQLRRTVLDLEGDRVDLQERLAATLLAYRRLLAWRLPEPSEAK